MKGTIIWYRGLGDSDEEGMWCGAKLWIRRLAQDLGLYVVDKNWNDKDADAQVDLARQAGSQFIVVGGHSHGAWRAKRVADRYGPNAFDVLGLVDYCPFLDPFAQLGPAILFPDQAVYGYACWQHNSAPTGCEFKSDDKKIIVQDTTAWIEPRLGHIDFPEFGLSSIAGDSRVWSGPFSLGEQIELAWKARQNS